jgi:cholesterol transport system auxiliary component
MARVCLAAMVSMAVATSGCALLTKSEPVVPRYFTPELAETTPRLNAAVASPLSVRLGRIGGGSYLKERIVYRDSEHELGFYEDRRWTERPEVYLQRGLEESLFEERGLKRALSATAPTLTADLVEFEEVKGSAPHVRLRVSYALHDETTVFVEHSFSIERPLPAGPDASRTDRVAAALGEALHAAVARITGDVVGALSARTSPAP